MAAQDLVDPFGRTIRDLRISVTDRCNFRCTYCMPAEGMVWLPKSEVLTFEEIERLARLFVERYGVDGIRLTGGEPTVRAHLPVLIAKLAALKVPVDSASPLAGESIDLALTTNASTLANCADELRRAGLRRINISLDSLDRAKFEQMTRRDELDRVLVGIQAAIDTGFESVKINAVIERGVNDDEILDLADFGRRLGIEVRFIEFMPLDAEGHWDNEKVVSQDEIVSRIGEAFPLESVPARGAAPADRWRYLDGKGTVGVIPSVTKPFCADCDRVRLTADGQFRTCLFATTEFDLRALLRNGADDDTVAAEIERAVGTKWAGHQINQVNFVRPGRSMSQIGG
ncbi:MAG: GTP 3',8-cyclase MoaA [Ilumatobacteraceae bacterium]|jgi:cyclic pyranopterin phosphate synthase|nr:GTP 3',8-cyclase MoaA [Actinomycetota bacterium]MDA3012294.1 GTP 3',8-cyclase MoaA [Actinomycetota bacterium]MDA3024807.1 GTP 3',8-cyclase MoaA [Actinomycetota bacterium]NBU55699.1 GTP 3',8-cyclase MoaA [Acidimicrobiia bacterium]